MKYSQANMDLPMKPLHPPWPSTSQEVIPSSSHQPISLQEHIP